MSRLNKADFFAVLDQLDHDDDDDPEDESFERLVQGFPRVVAALDDTDCPKALTRANTEPSPSVPLHPDITRSETTNMSPKATGPASKKRKTNSFKAAPQEQQILRGLVFSDYLLVFFPNNDKSPIRRLRIQRVQEYGATWAHEWIGNITHVVVEKGIKFKELLFHLKLDSLPDKMIIVNDTYPSECIRFRSILSPAYARFQVEGVQSAEKQDPAMLIEGEPSSTKSFPPKSPIREEDSPPKSSGSVSTDRQIPAAPTHKAMNTGLPTCERDALDIIIDEAKAIQHLPLDLDFLDEDSENESGNETSRSSSSERPQKKRQEETKAPPTKGSWEKNFACMQNFDSTVKKNNVNRRTIEVLQQLLDYYDRTADHWRIIAYRRAITALGRQEVKIMTRAQALAIHGIGPRLADKIEEIVLTDRLRRLDETKFSVEDKLIQQFLGIYGCGLAQASKWVAQGYRSLDDLRDRAPLSKNQRIGLERYDDFAIRIPRKEVEGHGAIVREAVKRADADMQVILGGSFRRGAPDCGDIDCLITKQNSSLEHIRDLVMNHVVPKLFEDGFLKVGLASSRQAGDGSKWHGASALPGNNIWRRIDLLFVPGAEYGAALLYFTGNDIFNRSMRLLARKKGLCLNQRGLFANVIRNSETQVKTNPGELLEGQDERRIFSLLGVPWRPPEHRIC
ncbi:DNA polymerase family X [Penicillium taxi]|uniref:DNA polymerase family X n=1 Tax=Penicillium taxi TaxID=168475 RepID=UPI00254505B5|nr:DNA polymerase family X [Penicillium taxi]KAJ5893971.1 DNA polymerase family X [Penicillium taxi]